MLSFIALLATTANLASARPAAPVIVNPDWERRPTVEEITAYYPEAAAREHTPGTIVMQCRVLVTGYVDSCKIISEAPYGQGFANAALEMAPLFRMRPKTINGAPVEAAVRIPITFTPRERPEPTDLQEALDCYAAYGRLAEASPRDPALVRAAGYFGAMLLMRMALRGDAPSAFEVALTAARTKTAPSAGDLEAAREACEARLPQ